LLTFKNPDQVKFTADQHYWHTNVIKNQRRPFTDAETMNEEMIARHNAVVGPKDFVFIVGDFSFGGQNKKLEVIKRLNGRKFMCQGSHDANLHKLRGCFEDLRESYLIKIGDQIVFLSHYLHKSWPRSHYGSWHLHGHHHGRMENYAAGEGKILDVGVDGHGFRPWTWSEVFRVMAERPKNFNQP